MAEVTEERIDVCEGKYTVVLRSDGTSTALRYGVAEWPAYIGQQLDNLTTALARDLIDAHERLGIRCCDEGCPRYGTPHSHPDKPCPRAEVPPDIRDRCG